MKSVRILITSTLLFHFSCTVKNKKFDKSTWNDRNDIIYVNREKMVHDLMENHLKKGMNYQEVLALLGKHDYTFPPNTLGYEVMVKYIWTDIDPRTMKTLYIELTKDSLVKDFRLEEIED